MGLKVTILILGLFAMLLLVSSEVASTNSKEVTKGVEDAKYPGGGYGGGYPGGGYGGGYPGYGVGYPGYGGRGRGYPGRGGGYRRGRYCGYGCCGGWTYNGVCTRCCSYAAEAVAAQTQDNTHN